MSRALLAALLAALLLTGRTLQAQDSTLVLGTTQALQASGVGFLFAVKELQFGSRCFGAGGQNSGKGVFLRLTSEALNGYGKSICRHTGFEGKTLQNGWKVSAVSRTTTCQYNDFGTWRTLSSSNCVFVVLSSPAVNSTSAFFKVDATLFGSALQDRRATMTWSITLRGPRGKSPWTAQPPTAPTLVSPANNVQLAGIGQFTWTAPSTGATHYRLCISRESWTGACEERARPTVPQAFNVTLPFRGERIKWFVQGCNGAGCTSSPTSLLIRNTLPAATLVSPAASATVTTRRPTFQWQSVPGAQTYTLYVYHANPLQEFVIPNLSSNVTQFTPASGLALDNPMYWSVWACTTVAGCGTAAGPAQLRSLNLPPKVLFSTLAPTFRHARCSNCHAVEATSYQPSTPGLPTGHASVTAASNCQSCHTNTLLPTAGLDNPGWHAPPAAMDFRFKTDQQLCAQANSVGDSAAVLRHLHEDKLILWAVSDGRKPSSTTPLSLAPPGTLSGWRTLVVNWINGGRLCS